MNICFSINRGYLWLCMVTIYSILVNNRHAKLNIYIIHADCITEGDITLFLNKVKAFNKFNNFSINLIDISKHSLFDKINRTNLHWTREVNFKILTPSLFPTLNKILYLDCDLIVKGNLQEFYNIDMTNYLFCGDKWQIGNNSHVCFGALLINLALARTNNSESEIIDYLENHQETEEEAYNNLYESKKLYASEYIYTLSTRRKTKINKNLFKSIAIIHYIGRKPWQMAPFRKLGLRSTKEWYKYLAVFIKQEHKLYFCLLSLYAVYGARIVFSIIKIAEKIIKPFNSKLPLIRNFVVKKIKPILIAK